MPGIYQVTLRSSYFDRLPINVFHYLINSVGYTPSALALLTAMGFIPTGSPLDFPSGTLAAAIQALASNSLQFLEVECRELYSETDFYIAAYASEILGTQEGQPASPALALGFKSNRTTLAVKRGFKRFSGTTEDMTNDGGVINTSFNSQLVTLATKLGEQLSDGIGLYQPAVLSYTDYTNPEGKTYKVPYPTADEQAEHAAVGISYVAYDTIRTQTSRQYKGS